MREILNAPAVIRVLIGVCALWDTRVSLQDRKLQGVRLWMVPYVLSEWSWPEPLKTGTKSYITTNEISLNEEIQNFAPCLFSNANFASIRCNDSYSRLSTLNHASKSSGNRTHEDNFMLPCLKAKLDLKLNVSNINYLSWFKLKVWACSARTAVGLLNIAGHSPFPWGILLRCCLFLLMKTGNCCCVGHQTTENSEMMQILGKLYWPHRL